MRRQKKMVLQGYFDKGAAEREAKKLRKQGYTTEVRYVARGPMAVFKPPYALYANKRKGE